MQAFGPVVLLSLRMAKVLDVVSVILYCLLFALFFPIMANISILLSHWHSHINLYSQFSQFIRRCKDCNACKNW